jgi:hypothetical protein
VVGKYGDNFGFMYQQYALMEFSYHVREFISIDTSYDKMIRVYLEITNTDEKKRTLYVQTYRGEKGDESLEYKSIECRYKDSVQLYYTMNSETGKVTVTYEKISRFGENSALSENKLSEYFRRPLKPRKDLRIDDLGIMYSTSRGAGNAEESPYALVAPELAACSSNYDEARVVWVNNMKFEFDFRQNQYMFREFKSS